MNRAYVVKLFVIGIMMLGLFASPLTPEAAAINVFQDDACGGANAKTDICGNTSDSIYPLARTIIRVLLIALGVISVIMIIVGGLKYTISDGDSSKIKSAKDTILYSIVGLVIALLAYSIVNFVVAQFS